MAKLTNSTIYGSANITGNVVTTGQVFDISANSGINLSAGNSINSVVIANNGIGYQSVPSVIFSNSTTGGVTANANVIIRISTTAVIGNVGVGYANGDVLYANNANGLSNAFFTVTDNTATTFGTGGIRTLTINNTGLFFTLPNYYNTNNVLNTGTPAYLQITGATSLTGSGANVNISASGFSVNNLYFSNYGSEYVEQPAVTFSGGSPTTAATGYAIVGGNIPKITSIGNGLDFYTPGGQALKLSNTTGSVNYLNITGGPLNGGPTLFVSGSDTNAELKLKSKGLYNIALQNGNGNNGFVVDMTSGTTLANYLQVSPKVAGLSPIISTQGTDTNIDLNLQSKGNSNVNIIAANTVISGNLTSGNYVITGSGNGITFVDGTKQTTAYNSGVDTTQNNNISIVQGGLNTANANISLIFGIDTSQNTRMSAIETVDTNQNTAITLIQAVDVYQNTRIDAAFTKANTGAVAVSYLANSVIFANSTGYLSNTSNIQFYTSNNTLVVANLSVPTLYTTSGGIVFPDGTTQATAASGAATDALARSIANSASSNTVVTQAVDLTQNTNIAIAQGGLNTANANIALIFGIDTSQNNRMSAIETVDTNQNTNISIVQGGLNSANANIALIQGVDVSQNTNIAIAQGGLNTANANISLLFAIDNAQNVNTTIVQGGLNTANANISLIFGIDTSQNTRMSAIETVDTNQNTAITLIQGVDVYQNNNISIVQGGLNSANANIALNQGVDVYQNTRMTAIETVDTNQNTAITLIQGVDVYQNNNISIVQGGLNTANANISLLFSIDNAQNNNTTIVQGGLNSANANIAILQIVANTDYTTVSSPTGTFGSSSLVPVVTVAANGRVTNITTAAVSGGGSSSNSFSTILVSGQPNIIANTPTSPLTLVAGSGITITTVGTSNTITFASTGGFSGGTIANQLIVANTLSSYSNSNNALQVSGGVGVANSVYVGNRVGFGNTSTSLAYTTYNSTFNSIDTIFG